MNPFKSDCHLHSRFSPDGRGTAPEAVVDAALACGLDGICFTDHCECNSNNGIPPEFPQWPDLDAESYFNTITALKDKYPLKISVGVEIGQGTQNPECARRFTDSYSWDFILASNHNIRNEYDFSYMNYEGRDIDDLCRRYFEELLEIAEWGQFDVLAHLFYFIRYVCKAGYEIDINKYNGMMVDIFKVLVSKNKGIEINTSSLNGPYGKTIPGLEQLKLFRQLGGEIVTIGSDAHVPQNVGFGGDIAREIMREAGFKYVAFYEKRTPIFMPI